MDAEEKNVKGFVLRISLGDIVITGGFLYLIFKKYSWTNPGKKQAEAYLQKNLQIKRDIKNHNSHYSVTQHLGAHRMVAYMLKEKELSNGKLPSPLRVYLWWFREYWKTTGHLAKFLKEEGKIKFDGSSPDKKAYESSRDAMYEKLLRQAEDKDQKERESAEWDGICEELKRNKQQGDINGSDGRLRDSKSARTRKGDSTIGDEGSKNSKSAKSKDSKSQRSKSKGRK